MEWAIELFTLQHCVLWFLKINLGTNFMNNALMNRCRQQIFESRIIFPFIIGTRLNIWIESKPFDQFRCFEYGNHLNHFQLNQCKQELLCVLQQNQMTHGDRAFYRILTLIAGRYAYEIDSFIASLAYSFVELPLNKFLRISLLNSLAQLLYLLSQLFEEFFHAPNSISIMFRFKWSYYIVSILT